MASSLLCGFEHDDIQLAKVEIEKRFSVQLESHDSLYLGEYYRHLSNDQAIEILLRRNTDPLFDPTADSSEDRWAEPNFSTWQLLVYIEIKSNPESASSVILLLSHVPSLRLLREEHK